MNYGGALLVITTVWCCLVACGESVLPNSVVPNNLGVNIHFTSPQPGELEMLNGEGFSWIRMDFQWEWIERTPGQYDFSAYDVLVEALKKQNMSALFILDYGNPLYDQGLAPYTDAGRTAFANFALAGISRYSGTISSPLSHLKLVYRLAHHLSKRFGLRLGDLERAQHQLLEARAKSSKLHSPRHRRVQDRQGDLLID